MIVCRICIRLIENNDQFTCLRSGLPDSLVNLLQIMVSHFDLEIVPNAVICNSCLSELHLIYKFREMCMQTEEKIARYVLNLNPPRKLLNTDLLEAVGILRDDLSCLEDNVSDLPSDSQSDEFGVNNTDGVEQQSENVKEEMAVDEFVGNVNVVFVKTEMEGDVHDFGENVDSDGIEEDKSDGKVDCGLCIITESFKQKLTENFQRIMRSESPQTPPTITIAIPDHAPKRQKPFACNLCTKHFMNGTTLQRHKHQYHCQPKPYKCQVCGRQYVKRRFLTQHQKVIHSPTISYACDVCGKAFVTSRYLEVHKETHKEV